MPGSALRMHMLFYIVLIQAEELYSSTFVISGHNVTLPMILSEWHKLSNNSLGAFLESLAKEQGGADRMDWMQANGTLNVTQILQQRS